jgi:hypothetical protein
MKTVLAYLKNPTVKPGEYQAPDDADAEPAFPDQISKMNLIPVPLVLAKDYPTATLWGIPDTELCTY